MFFSSASGTNYVCNGVPGPQGLPGANGTYGTNGTSGISVTGFPGDHVSGVTYDGTNFRVTHSGDNLVYRVRASDGTVLSSAFDGVNVWVANAGTLSKV